MAFLYLRFEYKKPGEEQSDRTRQFLPKERSDTWRGAAFKVRSLKENITFLANLNIC